MRPSTLEAHTTWLVSDVYGCQADVSNDYNATNLHEHLLIIPANSTQTMSYFRSVMEALMGLIPQV